jgi:hypothetical protein
VLEAADVSTANNGAAVSIDASNEKVGAPTILILPVHF